MLLIFSIAIHRHQHLTAGMAKTGHERCCLTEIAAEMHDFDQRITGREFIKQISGAVAAAVIHEDDLIGIIAPDKSLSGFIIEVAYGANFVIDRHNNGDHGGIDGQT